MKRKLLICAVALSLAGVIRVVAEDPAPAEPAAPEAMTAPVAEGAGDTNAVTSTDTNVNTRTDMRSFDVMQTRNIFNPNRRVFRPRVDTGPRIQIDYFKLNGTMTYEDKAYAFFDGTSGAFRNKTLGKADKIGGYTIAEITNNAVKLMASSNQAISLRVGMQMRRENNGPWKLVANGDIPAEPSSTDSSDSSSGEASSSGFTTSGSGAVDDVIKRLMERREKESKDPSTGNDKQNENN